MLPSIILAALMCIGVQQVVDGHHIHQDGTVLGPIFAGNKVVPDVLDEAPTDELKVEYGNNISVNYVNILTPTEVKAAPQVVWEAEPEGVYTLLMVDPDAGSGQWLHWGVVNIPGNNLTAGHSIAEYVGAGPPMGSGLHRYVFIVFKQDHSQDFKEPTKTIHDPYRQFSVRDFAKKHALGKPLAGNLFQAEYDDYVPILYTQFKV